MAFMSIINGRMSIPATAAMGKDTFCSMTGGVPAAGAKCLGVNIEDVISGDMASIAFSGIKQIISGGIFNAGDPITTDANGQAVKAANLSITTGATQVTGDAASPTFQGAVTPVAINGYSLDASAVSGTLVRIKIA
jgi:hypothetical protein